MLEKAGYNSDRIGVVLAKSLAVAESIIDDPNVDPFAKMAAIKLIVRDIAAVAPMKTPGPQREAQTPVVINIGELPPAPAREPRAIGSHSTKSQTRAAIDLPPNPA